MTEALDVRRRAEALETACGLFMRFGYRKTSMDDIARAVGISRQGLYLWFPNKEALFVSAVDHLQGRIRDAIEASLSDESLSPIDRVLGAFDAYVGVNLSAGMNAGAMDELLETATKLIGDRVTQIEEELITLLARELEGTPRSDLSARDLAEVLYAVSAGTKYRVASREEYLTRMRTALRAVCGW